MFGLFSPNCNRGHQPPVHLLSLDDLRFALNRVRYPVHWLRRRMAASTGQSGPDLIARRCIAPTRSPAKPVRETSILFPNELPDLPARLRCRRLEQGSLRWHASPWCLVDITSPKQKIC